VPIEEKLQVCEIIFYKDGFRGEGESSPAGVKGTHPTEKDAMHGNSAEDMLPFSVTGSTGKEVPSLSESAGRIAMKGAF